MSLFNFASSLKRILRARPTRGQRRSSPRRASLLLEHLEDRFAPAGGIPYTVTDLWGGEAYGINASTQVVGQNGAGHAFLWSNGTSTDLGTTGGRSSLGLNINDSGDVVGWTINSGNTTGQGFLYHDGTMIGLTPSAVSGGAQGINAAGQVVGWYSNYGTDPNGAALGPTQPFLCSNGVETSLGTFPPNSDTYPLSINGSGQVVGYTYQRGVTGEQPFLIENGTTTILGVSGAFQMINDSGEVVGGRYYSNTLWHAQLYANGMLTDLGTLGGSNSWAYGINSAGQIVGDSITASGADHAFLYSNGTMTDLNGLIDPRSGWTLETAFAINNKGEIVGLGLNANGQSDGFLLTMPALTADALTPPVATEGAPVSNAVLFHFSDADPNATASEYVATVNTGDAILTSTANPSNVTIVPDTVNGGFDVQLSYTYVEELHNATFSVSVTDVTASTSQSTSTFGVADAALTNVLAVNSNTALEGQASTVLLATFTDPAGPEVVGNYTADINWGDGTGNQLNSGSITYNSTTGNFEVRGTHTYAEESAANPYQVTIQLHHESATDPAPVTAQVTVQDVAVIVQQGQSQVNAVEGGDTNLVILATFTDPAGAEAVSDYSATVNWGDNTSPDNTFDTNPKIFIVQSGSTFLVEGSHLYTDESPAGGYTVATTISHELAPVSNTVTATAMVSDPSVNATGGFRLTALDGGSTGTHTVATFTDPAGAELSGTDPAPGAYSATIDWGDGGSTSSGTITYSGGTFTVQGGHTYDQEGTYTIGVLLQHGTPANVTVTSTASVTDQQISQPAVTAPSGILEGQPTGPLTALATFNDPGGVDVEDPSGDFTATIDWGDGRISPGLVVYTGSGNTYQVNAPSHTYVQEGPYTITVSVKHDLLPTLSGSATLTVGDQQITTPVVATLTPVEGTATGPITGIATFSDPACTGVEGTGDFTATIDWGDSTPTDTGMIVFLGNSSYRVDAPSHTYAEEGSHTLRVTVQHDAVTPPVTGTQSIAVSDAPLTNLTADRTLNATEAASTGSVLLATFTDPGGPEEIGEYSADINWGDGTGNQVGAGIIIYNSTTSQFELHGSHTYAEEEGQPFTITVQLHHEGSVAPAALHITANVADVALSNVTGGQHICATEMIGTSSVLLATFTDPGNPTGSLAEAGEYTADINWGDGMGTQAGAGVISYNSTTSQFEVRGSHTYAEESGPEHSGSQPYTITVTIHHETSTPAVASSSATVADPQLTNLASANLPAMAQAGAAIGPITGIATFTDPAGAEVIGDYTATINWGDTATDVGTVVALGNGNYRVDAPSHTYTTQGVYTVNVTLKHEQLAAVVTPIQTITLVFFLDKFNRGPSTTLGPNWTNRVGAPVINGANQATTTGTSLGLATANTSSVTNVSVQADFTLSGNGSSAGLVARYSGSGDGNGQMYLGRVILNSGVYTVEIDSAVGGVFTALGSTKTLTGFSGSGTLRFDVVGNSLKLFVNGVLQLAVNDSSITGAGLIGFRGRGTAALPTTFDNFTATTPTSATTTLPFSDSFSKPDNSTLDSVWTEQVGAFPILSGAATAFSPNAANTGLALATVNAAPVTDITVQADFTLNASAANAGLIARYSGTGDGNGRMYVGRIMQSGGTTTAQIEYAIGGTFHVLVSTTVAGLTGRHTLRFQVVGNTLKLFLDNLTSPLLSTTDSNITGAGLAGIRGNQASFDAFSAQ
jgi:probable HAF family extracellular repeat protein